MMKWMISGPEIASILNLLGEDPNDDRQEAHHEDTVSYEKKFRRDVISFKNVFDEIGNPFQEGDILINAISKQIMSNEAANSIQNAFELGKQQYSDYVHNRLMTCRVSVYERIPKNKLPLFREKNSVSTSKAKLRATSVKQDCKLFASLYVACQTREGDIGEFFVHENHAYPPSISEYGKLRKGNKSEFLKCLDKYGEVDHEPPPLVTAKVIDGAVLVQMTPPGKSKTFEEYSQSFAEVIL